MKAPSLPVGWPEGRSLAVAVNVMLEGWTDDSAPGIGPMGNPLKPGVLDLQARSSPAPGLAGTPISSIPICLIASRP